MVVHGGLRAGRDDQRRERETPITSAIEEPGANPGAHPAIWGRHLILLGKPGLVGQQLGKVRPDLSQDLPRVIMLVSDAADLGDEPAKSRIVDDVLILSSLDGGSHGNLLLDHHRMRVRCHSLHLSEGAWDAATKNGRALVAVAEPGRGRETEGLTLDPIRTEDDPVKEKTAVEGAIADAKVADRITSARGLLEQVARESRQFDELLTGVIGLNDKGVGFI